MGVQNENSIVWFNRLLDELALSDLHSGAMSSVSAKDATPANRSTNSTVLESMSHTAALLSGLNILREKNCLVDITILAEGEPMKVRRVERIKHACAFTCKA